MPLAAVAIFEEGTLQKLPTARKRIQEYMERHSGLAANLHMPSTLGVAGRRMLATVDEETARGVDRCSVEREKF